MKYHEKPAHFRELFSNLLPILLALFIWTNPVLAQNNGELITLSLKNKTIGEALETINKRYNYTFVLRTPDIDTKRKVSIDAKQQKIEDVLNNLFRGQDVSFDINNKNCPYLQECQAERRRIYTGGYYQKRDRTSYG